MKLFLFLIVFFLFTCQILSQTIDSVNINIANGNEIYLITTSQNDKIVISTSQNGMLNFLGFDNIKYPIAIHNYQNGRIKEIESNNKNVEAFWKIYFRKNGRLWSIVNISIRSGSPTGLFISFDKKGRIREKKQVF